MDIYPNAKMLNKELWQHQMVDKCHYARVIMAIAEIYVISDENSAGGDIFLDAMVALKRVKISAAPKSFE